MNISCYIHKNVRNFRALFIFLALLNCESMVLGVRKYLLQPVATAPIPSIIPSMISSGTIYQSHCHLCQLARRINSVSRIHRSPRNIFGSNSGNSGNNGNSGNSDSDSLAEYPLHEVNSMGIEKVSIYSFIIFARFKKIF